MQWGQRRGQLPDLDRLYRGVSWAGFRAGAGVGPPRRGVCSEQELGAGTWPGSQLHLGMSLRKLRHQRFREL